VDERHRLPIGRPYLTVAIDVLSRGIGSPFSSSSRWSVADGLPGRRTRTPLPAQRRPVTRLRRRAVDRAGTGRPVHARPSLAGPDGTRRHGHLDYAHQEMGHPGQGTARRRRPSQGIRWEEKGKNSTGHDNTYLARSLGEAAVGAAKTRTFLGERYRRIARRRGAKKAIVAVGRSILVIVWHLLSDPDARYHDLGADFYDNRINPERKKRSHVQQLEALGYTVTLNPVPAPPGRCRLPTPSPIFGLDAGIAT
jgi:hypothetical protein